MLSLAAWNPTLLICLIASRWQLKMQSALSNPFEAQNWDGRCWVAKSRISGTMESCMLEIQINGQVKEILQIETVVVGIRKTPNNDKRTQVVNPKSSIQLDFQGEKLPLFVLCDHG